MVALAGSTLADGRHLPAAEHWQGMGTIHTRAPKGQVLKSEGCTFRVADIVVVVVETSGATTRVRPLNRLSSLDFVAYLREEALKVRWDYGARLDKRCLQGVDSVSKVGKVLCCSIVGPVQSASAPGKVGKWQCSRCDELFLCLSVSAGLKMSTEHTHSANFVASSLVLSKNTRSCDVSRHPQRRGRHYAPHGNLHRQHCCNYLRGAQDAAHPGEARRLTFCHT